MTSQSGAYDSFYELYSQFQRLRLNDDDDDENSVASDASGADWYFEQPILSSHNVDEVEKLRESSLKTVDMADSQSDAGSSLSSRQSSFSEAKNAIRGIPSNLVDDKERFKNDSLGRHKVNPLKETWRKVRSGKLFC